MDMRNMIIAPAKAFTITPERRRESLNFEWPEDMSSKRRRVAMLPPKAVILTPGKRENPISIPMMAPMADPPETPSM